METIGRVLHEAWWYDVQAWLLTGGKERAFRERLVTLASPSRESSVLDVGCGTGTLAIAVKKRVGASGRVAGVDASAEMIGRARSKARRAGVDITFEHAIVQALPFPDAQFDLIFSTLMLHHLPKAAREQCLREMRRVLKPDGRVLIADFETSGKRATGLLGFLHRHGRGHVAQESVAAALASVGLNVVDSGSTGLGDIHYTLAATHVEKNFCCEGDEEAARER